MLPVPPVPQSAWGRRFRRVVLDVIEGRVEAGAWVRVATFKGKPHAAQAVIRELLKFPNRLPEGWTFAMYAVQTRPHLTGGRRNTSARSSELWVATIHEPNTPWATPPATPREDNTP